MKRIDKGAMVEVFTTNGGRITGTLYESWTESYGVTLEELPRPIDGARVERVRKLSVHEVAERKRLREKIEHDTFTDERGCRRLFELPGTESARCEVLPTVAQMLEQSFEGRRRALLDETAARNGEWFDLEMDKLDRWAEDRRTSLKADLDEIDQALKDARKAARLAPTLPEKLEQQRAVRTLESKREDAWRVYDQASREIDQQKDALLDEIGRRLDQRMEHETLFTLHWELA